MDLIRSFLAYFMSPRQLALDNPGTQPQDKSLSHLKSDEDALDGSQDVFGPIPQVVIDSLKEDLAEYQYCLSESRSVCGLGLHKNHHNEGTEGEEVFRNRV